MKRVHIFCEGQTEETFVREVLQDHLIGYDVFLNPIVLRTSATCKGGVVSYAKLKWQIEQKCREDSSSCVTTLIDLYGLPSDFPGKSSFENQHDYEKKVAIAEKAFNSDIDMNNFIANLLLHEYEALLFSDVTKFEEWFNPSVVDSLQKEASIFDNPEQINDSPTTAPSKRILKYCLGYNKPLHGSLIAMDIGLDVIRSQCKHFNVWLRKIENLGK